MNASDIMTRTVIAITPSTPVGEIAHIMAENNISGVPVLDAAGKLAGIVTEIDLIKRHARIHFPLYISFLEGLIYLESPKRYQQEVRQALGTIAEEVMSKPVRTIAPGTSIEDIATLMAEEKITPLPVVNKEGSIVGIVSHTDIIRLIEKAETEKA